MANVERCYRPLNLKVKKADAFDIWISARTGSVSAVLLCSFAEWSFLATYTLSAIICRTSTSPTLLPHPSPSLCHKCAPVAWAFSAAVWGCVVRVFVADGVGSSSHRGVRRFVMMNRARRWWASSQHLLGVANAHDFSFTITAGSHVEQNHLSHRWVRFVPPFPNTVSALVFSPVVSDSQNVSFYKHAVNRLASFVFQTYNSTT